MNISDDLLCLYSATIDQQDGSYLIEVPEREIRNGDLSADEVYKIALVTTSPDRTEATQDSAERQRPDKSGPSPPVEEGDIREVEIEGLGEQGDGVGKIDGGYVVIVPETEPGDVVTVEIETVRSNFAIAETIQGQRE